jgi:hypothetical protein
MLIVKLKNWCELTQPETVCLAQKRRMSEEEMEMET